MELPLPELTQRLLAFGLAGWQAGGASPPRHPARAGAFGPLRARLLLGGRALPVRPDPGRSGGRPPRAAGGRADLLASASPRLHRERTRVRRLLDQRDAASHLGLCLRSPPAPTAGTSGPRRLRALHVLLPRLRE